MTIRHVAKAAGVSVKTVSRVLNDEATVHPDTRARVLLVIKDLGFRPNPLARSLVSQRTSTIGLMVPDLANIFFAAGAYGCVATAEQKGYHLVVDIGGPADVEARHLQALLDQRVSGIISWTTKITEQAVCDIMSSAQPVCPIVFIDSGYDTSLQERIVCGLLSVQQRQVGEIATAHLLAEGRRRIAHLGDSGWVGDQRLRGYLQTLEAAGCPPEERWIHMNIGGSVQRAAMATLELLGTTPYPDGIFAFNDAMGVGALIACQKMGLRVPEDVAVVGVDNTQMSAVTNPQLTTIRIFPRQTGEQATALLLRLIEHETLRGPGFDAGPRETNVPPPALVVRGSSTLRMLPAALLEEPDL